jgi:hypothetical protein
MGSVALVHRTLVPEELRDAFIRDWKEITRLYGAPNATLHQTRGGQFIQLVIWPSREEADKFTREFIFGNEIIKKYLPYAKIPQEVTEGELLRYRSKLPPPLVTILK